MSDSLYNLVIVAGTNTGMSFPLEDGEFTIGRSSKSDFCIEDDHEVSREHARITYRQGTVMVEDLESSHGTFLNNSQLHGVVSLTIGDLLQVGHTVLRLDMPTYTSQSSAEDEATIAMDSGTQGAGSATAFDSVELGPATRIDSELGQLEADHQGASTRVLDEERTRMLEGGELQDLKPGRHGETSRMKPLLGLLAVLVLFVSLIFAIKLKNATPVDVSTTRPFGSDSWGFNMTIPKSWRAQKGSGELVGVFNIMDNAGEKIQGNVVVLGKESDDYQYMAMYDVFSDYVKERRGKINGYSLLRSRLVSRGRAKVISYSFRSPDSLGSGIFLLDGEKRLGLEGQAAPDVWPLIEEEVGNALSRFRLTGEQSLLTYSDPTREMKALAITNADKLLADAAFFHAKAEEFERRKDAHYSNLYEAVTAFRECMQRCAALSSPPAFYRDAAKGLLKAERELMELLDHQKATIQQATAVMDIDAVCKECQIMLLMIPDPTHKYNQNAKGHMKKYCN